MVTQPPTLALPKEPRTRWLKLNYPWVESVVHYSDAGMNERVTPLTRHKQTDKWTLCIGFTKDDWLWCAAHSTDFKWLAPGNHSNSFLTKSPISTRFACWLVATWLLFSQLNVSQNISTRPFHILQFQVCLAFCDNCSRKGWVGGRIPKREWIEKALVSCKLLLQLWWNITIITTFNLS